MGVLTMNEMCRIVPHYRCPKCGQDMLFFVTKRQTLIDYKGLIPQNTRMLPDVKNYLEDKNVRCFKCLSCNHLYIIDWSDHFPKPLTDKSQLAKFGV